MACVAGTAGTAGTTAKPPTPVTNVKPQPAASTGPLRGHAHDQDPIAKKTGADDHEASAPGQTRAGAGTPTLSVVVLTLNEEKNVEAAVRSLLDQEGAHLEVLVVDSASRDRTVPIVRRLAKQDPRVRLITSRTHLAIGRARNMGVEHARGGYVAFMSADATAAPGWARAAVDQLARAAIVYGRQEHQPPTRSVAAAVRGLRYHHYRRDAKRPPEAYASNVNAAVQRHVFDRIRYVDDGAASALDDILFTKQAQAQGHTVAYRRDMLVCHKDAVTLRQEFEKNRREGHGWGLLADQLGTHHVLLAWGAALLVSLALLVIWPHPASIALLPMVLYVPALRRAAASVHQIRRAGPAWFAAILLSPLFDLAFLFAYLDGLRHRRNAPAVPTPPQGA